MTKYTKQQREDAILICDIAASGGVVTEVRPERSHVYSDIAIAVDVDHASQCLSILAYSEVMSRSNHWTREVDAEAAQLLREGWSS